MTLALATSAFLLGLAGGPHCAVMCGALQAGVAHRATTRATQRAALWLQLGRLIGYAAAGALVTASVSALSSMGSGTPLLKPIWSIFQVSALAFGVALLATGRVPVWLSRLTLRRSQPQPQPNNAVRFMRRAPSGLKAAGAGACWAVMPCGLLQSALIVAALSNTALQGAGVMSAFAIGTSISLFAVTSAWGFAGAAAPRWARPTLSVRLAGALLAASSTFALLHGLGSALPEIFCV